jgi:acyl-CoA thioester hydrolase
MVSVPIQIRFADIDAARHVHNAVYLHWFETARIGLFRSFVPAEHDWLKQGLIIARNEIDHLRPVVFSDQIEVEVRCNNIGNKSIDLHYSVVRKRKENDICAEGRSVIVCFDHHAGKSIEVPADWRKALEEHRN